MPLQPDLLGLFVRGSARPWLDARVVDGHPAASALPSLGRLRMGSGPPGTEWKRAYTSP